MTYGLCHVRSHEYPRAVGEAELPAHDGGSESVFDLEAVIPARGTQTPSLVRLFKTSMSPECRGSHSMPKPPRRRAELPSCSLREHSVLHPELPSCSLHPAHCVRVPFMYMNGH